MSTNEVPKTITLDGVDYDVILAGSAWSEKEKIDLVNTMYTWDKMTEKKLSLKSASQVRIWVEKIPLMMAKSFGKVRICPGDKAANSPYKNMWGSIKAEVSDYKYMNDPDGSEEERPGREGPSGLCNSYI
jgi:hypothetical protein